MIQRLTPELCFFALLPYDSNPACGRSRFADQSLFCGHGLFFFHLAGPARVFFAVWVSIHFPSCRVHAYQTAPMVMVSRTVYGRCRLMAGFQKPGTEILHLVCWQAGVRADIWLV